MLAHHLRAFFTLVHTHFIEGVVAHLRLSSLVVLVFIRLHPFLLILTIPFLCQPSPGHAER